MCECLRDNQYLLDNTDSVPCDVDRLEESLDDGCEKQSAADCSDCFHI